MNSYYCLDEGNVVTMVAMDLSKVFDSLLYSLLISKLRTGRIQRVKFGDEMSGWELNQRGVPQGSVFLVRR